MNSFESYYKIFKTSWGILIGFRGDFIENPPLDADRNITRITDNLYFELNLSEKNIFIHSNRTLLENGIRWIADNIPSEKKLLIKLNDIDMNFCNFQLEGLFFAIADWICKFYSIEIPNYYVEYNKELNKYIFKFDESDNESEKLLYPKTDT